MITEHLSARRSETSQRESAARLHAQLAQTAVDQRLAARSRNTARTDRMMPSTTRRADLPAGQGEALSQRRAQVAGVRRS